MVQQHKKTVKDYVIATRPWSFPASAMPVVVTIAYLFWQDLAIDWFHAVWMVINIVVFHAAGNVWSDYVDHKEGVDAHDTEGAHSLTQGIFTSQEMKNFGFVLLGISLAGALGLVARTGLPLLWILLGAFVLTLLYPFFKYRALSDVVIFVVYGLLPPLATMYATTRLIDYQIMWVMIPVALLIVAILHANNVRDVETDRRAKIRTLAMSISTKANGAIYFAEMMIPFGWITGGVFVHMYPVWALLVWLAFPMTFGNMSRMQSYVAGNKEAISSLDELTAKHQMLFCILMIVGCVVGYYMK